MSDKTSQRTEEEMLDQTFVGYDEEMTVQTEDAAKDTASATPAASPDKKKNQNLLVYGAMGLAALGFLGFKFLGGNSAPPQQTQEPMQPTPTPQPAVQAPQVAQAPVAAATTEPVGVPPQPQVPVPTPVPATPEQSATVTPAPATTSSNVDPVAQYTGNTTSASLPKVEPKPEVKPEVQPEVKEVKTVNVEKVAAVTSSNAEAGSSNDKLLSQFQDMLDKKYDPQFHKIEKSLDEQKEVNKSIEERLARLEAGKSTKVVKTASESNESSNTASEVKPVKKIVRKPVVIKHKVETTVHHKNAKSEESDVLIDRTSVKTKPEIQKIEPVYPKVEIHSVYSGRIWTKNADGTLSTFAVGDKLPTGEVIKKIDEEKEKVTTDKRVISQ